MSIGHHPHDDTLLQFAAGRLAAGPSVVVAVHVGGCADCQARVGTFEALGGALLADMEPAEMDVEALDLALSRIGDAAPAPARRQAAIVLPRADLGIDLPPAMDHCGIGPWRRLAPGLRMSRVTIPDDPDADVMLLRVAAGKTLPEHTHSGREFTQVLSGAFSDERGHYRPGDMDEADAAVDHSPVVDQASECICLAAIEGRMRLTGFVGRIVQRFIS